MARLTSEQLEKLKERYNVKTIHSFSKLNTFCEQPWAFYMTYLHPDRVRTENIYTLMGTLGHDLLEEFYQDEFKREELADIYSNRVTDWKLSGSELTFPNENVEDGYVENLKHYFKHFEPVDFKMNIESPVKIVFQENKDSNIVFIGYMDAFYKDKDGNYIILDFKTSSKSQYTGKQLKNHAKQLLLYSIGVHQMFDIPLGRIKPRFDMMKYVNISFLQKNGKWKDSLQERRKMVKSQETKIKKILSEEGYDIFEIDDLFDLAEQANDFSILPSCITDKFRFSNAYIDVEFNEKDIKELYDWVIVNVKEMERKSNGDHEVEFPQPRLDGENEFYFNVLARQLLPYHKGWNEKQKLMQMNDEVVSIDDLEDLFR